MSDWFEWKDEDLKELNIKDFEFFDYLKEGLHPYSRYDYQPIHCPPEHHEYYHKSNRLDEISSLLKKLDDFAGEAGGKEGYIDYENPLYRHFLFSNCYQDINGSLGNSIPHRIHISLKDIENLKKEQKKEYNIIVKEMNAISIDDWKYLTLPSIKEKYDKLKSELTEGNIFKKDIALGIKGKFEAGKGKEVTSTGIDSQELAELKKEDYLKDPELIKLLKKARFETDVINDDKNEIIKELESFGYNLADMEKNLKEKIITVFENRTEHQKFEFMKKKYLEDPKLYKEDPAHPKRYFVGNLLKKIAKDKEHYPKGIKGKGNYEKLYELSE